MCTLAGACGHAYARGSDCALVRSRSCVRARLSCCKRTWHLDCRQITEVGGAWRCCARWRRRARATPRRDALARISKCRRTRRLTRRALLSDQRRADVHRSILLHSSARVDERRDQLFAWYGCARTARVSMIRSHLASHDSDSGRRQRTGRESRHRGQGCRRSVVPDGPLDVARVPGVCRRLGARAGRCVAARAHARRTDSRRQISRVC